MHKQNRAQRGFTLIELVVGMAIIAILGTMAITTYRTQMMKGRRSDAMASLSSMSQSLERCYAQNFAYTGCAAVTGGSSVPTINGYYQVSVNLDATSYTLTASASGPQANDKTCSQFIVSNAGQSAKDSVGLDQTVACWGSH
jgi:type IV pilus assembly protein PilE